MTDTPKPHAPRELEQLTRERLAAAGAFLEDRPVTAVAIGVAVGFLLARLLGDR